MAIKHHIRLSSEERRQLETLVRNPKVAAHKRTRGSILLGLDENGPALKEHEVSQTCGVTPRTAERVRKRCVEEGLEVAVQGKYKQEGRPRRLDGEGQAHLVALACSNAPAGHARWTLRLLSDRMVVLGHADFLSPATVHRELKKTS